MDETQALEFSNEDVAEDFYEAIEAPKFVDFSASDRCRPDDRYWFCSRVGCDQKHPEEMDSEVIYKNFVMRVMAARSPNVRLHRARRNMKCPLTAPPKSSKSRVSRLALISSISKRIVDVRVKSRPHPPKPSATPNVKPKQSHSKALTTPRNRERKSNPKAFRSVRKPKTTSAEEPKTRVVAKALVFRSPKKDVKNKTSLEMNTPVKTLCAAMKKLEITSAKKNVGGNPIPLDASMKKFRGREVKSRVFDSLGTKSCKGKDAKPARVLKRRSKEKNLKPPHDHNCHENVDEVASDMDIDEKSRQVSMEGCSLSSSAKSNERNQDEELPKIVEPSQNGNMDNLLKTSEGDETSISNSEEKSLEEIDFNLVLQEVEDKNQECNHEEGMKSGAIEMNTAELMMSNDKENVAESEERNRDEELSKFVEHAFNQNSDYLSENSEHDETSISNSELKNSEESNFRLVLCEVEDEKNQESNHERRMKLGTEMNISELMERDGKENVVSENKENAAAPDDIENESETTATDENENVAPNDNREGNSYNQSKRVAFGKPGNSTKAKLILQVKSVVKKTLKENSTLTTLGSHGLKSSRPKPTNPKPFRLRTDERGTLREANLEKKLNCPLKDITASRRICGDKLQRKNQHMNQKSETCLNNCERENHAKEDNEQKMLESKIQDDGQGDPGCNLITMDSQNCITFKHQNRNLVTCHEPGKEKATQKREGKLKTTKLEKTQQKDRKPQRDASVKKEINSQVPPCQTSLKILNYKDATKPSKSLSRGRRPVINPKEPNLHSSHLPKSCSRKLA